MRRISSVTQSRYSVLIIFIIISFILAGCISGCSNPKSSTDTGTGNIPEYVEKVFGTDIISIEIIADETAWQNMLDNATKEEYIKADVVINGTTFSNVGIRPKGNSSLRQVASSESDRYSFRIKFDEYVKGRTCFGLDNLVVNNMHSDNTYMKEYISFDLMKTIGVDCPYFGYSKISVNGEPWGLYLAIELYNDSYEKRVFGDTFGMLYNVKTDMGNIGGKNGQDAPPPPPVGQNAPAPPAADNQNGRNVPPMADEKNSRNINPPGRPDNGFFPLGRGGKMGASNGGSLQYTDDNPSSYSAIFDNTVGKGTETDYRRVIRALKALSSGTDLEEYFDVDAILRYLAAHTMVVNLDSYSSSMAQNYYLYEKDGKITILPWDYNLAWGGFQSRDAASVINFPIDTPVSGVEMADRPLLDKLFANQEYQKKYHQYMQELIDNYFANGKFKAKVEEINTLIADYVKNDATAFCTYEEYEKAVKSLITLGELRAESVQGQLAGTIPSTTVEQTANPNKLVSAGNLNISDLGSMMGGKGEFPPGGFGNQFPGGKPLDMKKMQNAMKIIQDAGGKITDEVKIKLKELGFNDEQISMLNNMKRMPVSK